MTPWTPGGGVLCEPRVLRCLCAPGVVSDTEHPVLPTLPARSSDVRQRPPRAAWELRHDSPCRTRPRSAPEPSSCRTCSVAVFTSRSRHFVSKQERKTTIFHLAFFSNI